LDQKNNSSIVISNNKILFAGDVMLTRSVGEKIKNIYDEKYIFPFLNALDYLYSFKYIIVNLEGPVSDRGEKVGSKYSFKMDPKILSYLEKSNIKVFNLANNHIWDYGRTAFLDTLNNLKQKNFYYFGAGEDEKEAYKLVVLDVNGNSVGLLGFTEFLGHIRAKTNSLGVAFLEEKKFEEAITKARQQVDILVVVFHWGEEYKENPNQKQIYYAHKAIDLGADLIIGHHPHIVQKIEIYKNKYIFYSLGNFIFDQYFSKETMQGGLVEVEVNNKKIQDISFRYSYLNNNFQIEKISSLMKIYELENKIYKLLIAQNEKEWTQGLMNVKCPCDFDGMLFIFPDKEIRSFWNQNTFLDLDVYWLDDNKVVGKNYLPSILKTREPLVINSPSPVNRVIEIIIKE
jgi:poly-gamma-glutamate capsule biosynthesis protein CapA/YwtB (metallophosphatase superfamily)/uncharacterized membrane protein (UPF0127 family)